MRPDKLRLQYADHVSLISHHCKTSSRLLLPIKLATAMTCEVPYYFTRCARKAQVQQNKVSTLFKAQLELLRLPSVEVDAVVLKGKNLGYMKA